MATLFDDYTEPTRYIQETPLVLRPYQEIAVHNAWYAWHHEDVRATLLVLPTGTGKTRLAAGIAQKTLEAGGDFLFLVHKEELFDQAFHTFTKFFGPYGVGAERAGERSKIGSGAPRIVVAMKDTLYKKSRLERLGRNRFMVIGIDEAHRYGVKTRTYADIVDYFTAYVFGLTATPERGDKVSMSYTFQGCSYVYHVLDACEDGWLVRPEQKFAYVDGYDLSRVERANGDLNPAQLEEVMNQERPLYGLCTAAVEWANYQGKPRQTIVFTPGVESAKRCAEILNRWHAKDGTGAAASVYANSVDLDRAALVSMFRRGELRYLVNFGIFLEGFDVPTVENVVIGRATTLRGVYAQMAGRAMRPLDEIANQLSSLPDAAARKAAIAASAKPVCRIIDLVGVSGKHKLCGLLDVLGGKHPPHVLASARKLSFGQKEYDPGELLAQAATDTEALRRRGVVVAAKLKTRDVDPFDPASGTGPLRKKPKDKKPITAKQRAFLLSEGYSEADVDKMSRKRAGVEIGWLKKRRSQGLCSYRQRRILLDFGYDPNSTREAAREIITSLRNHGKLGA